ncbi:MAG: hypothetical protein Q4C01_07205 [Clostridia bacterium]|nr:hypothetical protein [Clostridia bacterium]
MNQIFSQALRELNRPNDNLSIAKWQEQFLRFANEAIVDIAASYRLWRKETARLQDNRLNTDNLSYACVKVLTLERDGVRIPFYYGTNSDELRTKNVPDGELTITYRYMPPTVTTVLQSPELPACLHPLIVTFIVARERIQLDSAARSGSKVNLDLYETMKKRLRVSVATPDDQSIYGI